MKKPTFKRVLAFIIDFIIITIISSAFTNIKFINPTLDKYEETYNEYIEYVKNDLTSQNISEITNSEKYQDITYNLSYYGRYSSLITLVISFLYYVLFQYFTGGYTGGKKILKIKVESMKGKLKIYQLMIRSLIVNSLFTSSLSLILLFSLNKNSYNNIGSFVGVLELGLLFLTFGLIIYRKDGRGLHDILAGTKVVNDKLKEEL